MTTLEEITKLGFKPLGIKMGNVLEIFALENHRILYDNKKDDIAVYYDINQKAETVEELKRRLKDGTNYGY